jgi:hypothetical protein
MSPCIHAPVLPKTNKQTNKKFTQSDLSFPLPDSSHPHKNLLKPTGKVIIKNCSVSYNSLTVAQ